LQRLDSPWGWQPSVNIFLGLDRCFAQLKKELNGSYNGF